MARTVKKKKELTIEEKVAEALVPVEEQPYQVPENWCWTKIGSLIEILNGYAFKSKKYVEKGIRIIRIANVQDGYIEDEKPVFYPFDTEKEIEKYILRENDLLISLTGNVGRVAFLNASLLPAALNQRVGCLRVRNQELLSIVFLYYYLLQSEFQDSCVKNSKGSAQLNMSTEWLKMQPVSLPPLAEQQRIVDRIESLFAKLDEAKEKAQAVVDGFEDRKVAILHKAFTGELTAGWRDEKGTSLDDWKYTSLKECSSAIGDGLHGTPLYDSDGQYYFINGNNFEGEKIVIKEDTKTVNHNEYNKHKKDLSPDATVFVSINGTLGKTAFFNNEPVILGKSACYVNVLPNLSKYYLRWFFESKEFIEYANEKATGSTIKNLGLKAMRNLPLHLPSVFEQIKIVQTLDILMQSEQQAKEAAEQVISQIDTMKKSILARAFRGELGTNDTADESAVELLKRIL